jgi:hypothetical protein
MIWPIRCLAFPHFKLYFTACVDFLFISTFGHVGPEEFNFKIRLMSWSASNLHPATFEQRRQLEEEFNPRAATSRLRTGPRQPARMALINMPTHRPSFLVFLSSSTSKAYSFLCICAVCRYDQDDNPRFDMFLDDHGRWRTISKSIAHKNRNG